MKKTIAIALTCLAAAGSAFADTNVALNGTVTVAGSGIGQSPGWGDGVLAAPSSVTDGLFLPTNTQWNLGTVYWTGSYGADSVTIDLLQAASVNSLYLQADNNDDYRVQYRDTANVWHDLVTISPHRSVGMDYGSAALGAPVLASAFMITAVGGDGAFSVSEFQAFGSAVPEPETYAMLGAGLGLMAFAARRKQRKA
ncbi:PEP-CTERM sorting domain-containing protein [Oxalobacteraceae bacterium]|nr:PEP-CTERM sorting domain-containing protein [Oxalobacteraceae bacterium]